MRWADNYWLFCHDRATLIHMVNDVIEELLDLDMEPKPESLWWTSTYEEEEKLTLQVRERGKNGIYLSSKSSMYWGIDSIVRGKVHKELKRPCAKEWEACGGTFISTVLEVFL